MIRQGKDVRSDLSLATDVVIVGSGAGGAPLAAELSMAGVRVVVLEKGPFTRAEDMTQDWGTMYPKMVGRRGIGTARDFGVNLSYAETLGGSTVHYWADSFRLPADRLDRWNREFGLGIDPGELSAIFDRCERNLSIHRTPDGLFNDNNRLVRLGVQLMRRRTGDDGYRGKTIPMAAKACIGCGFREVGCSYNAKQSQLVSYIPMASRAGAKIFTDCDVRELMVEGGRAVGVRGFVRSPRDTGPQGPKVEVRAKQAVVIAGNGLTTPEFLLRNGLGNRNIGHNLVVNPGIWVWARHPRKLNFRSGPPAAWHITGFRAVRRDAQGRYLEGGWEAIPDIRDASTAAALLGFAGDELRARMEDFKHLASIISVLDDEPHFENQVTLDSNGDWQADYRLRGDDAAKARDYLRKMARIYFAAGFERVYVPWGRTIEKGATMAQTEQAIDKVVDSIAGEPGDLAIAGPHLLASARMGASPETSVCDPTGQAHEMPGLYLAGGAALPTSVSEDPSLTIIGFSTLLARRLLRQVGKDLVKLRWTRTRDNHTQITGGPKAALGYDAEQRALRRRSRRPRRRTKGASG